MLYHVIIDIGHGTHWWTNLDYETLIQTIVIPYINKQVVSVNRPPLGRALFNFASAYYLAVFKTAEALPEDEGFDLSRMVHSPEFQKAQCTNEIVEQFLISKSAAETKSLLQTIFMPTKPQVFVIMKFGDKALNSAYEGAIKPIIKQFKYLPLRIDEIQDSGKISDQILQEIASSEIVVSDLSGARPNCYYEAGFAHAIGKEIIFTIQKGSSIHFDLAAYRFIEWETEQELRAELRKRFKAIKKRQKQVVKMST